MDIEQAAAAAGLREIPDAWRAAWPESESFYDSSGPWQLSPGEIRWAADFARLSHELAQMLAREAETLGEHEKRLIWCAKIALLKHRGGAGASMAGWPEPGAGVSHTFYALMFLSAVPDLCAINAGRRIPASVTVATLRDIQRWMNVYREDRGVWGLGRKSFLLLHFRGLLYELGRLQFEMRRFEPPFRVYANPRQGTYIAVACEGGRFREDGQFFNADGEEAPIAWEAELAESADGVTANTVAEGGRAYRRDVRLPASEWECLARPGAKALSVHISAGQPLDPAACAESFERAREFFPRHFTKHRFGVFACWTWMLDPQLAEVLPPTANLVQFLRLWRGIPLPGAHDEQTVERVFGRRVDDPLAITPRTSLQRAVQDRMRAGRRWRQGGGVIPFASLDGASGRQ